MLQLIEDEMDTVEYRIPASDTKGHSARQWFRCIPVMARQVEQVVQARKFPYRTKGDLLRHALHRHMNWLASVTPIPTVMGQVEAILEIMRDEEMNNDFVLVFDKLSGRISQHLADGAQEEAIRLVLMIRSHINNMPDGFWKSKYQNKLEEKYGRMLSGVKKCNLGEMTE